MTSELELHIALAVGAITVLLSVGLVLQVLAMRLRGVRRARRSAVVQARWRPILARAALGDSLEEPLPALPRSERADVLMVWNQLQDGLRGSAHAGLNRLAERLGFHADACRWADRGGLAQRALGLATLGHLGRDEDRARLLAAMADARSPVSLAAARALLQIDARASAPAVLEQYLERPDWAAAKLGTLLREAGADAVTPALTALLPGLDGEAQLRLLPLMRFAESSQAALALHRLVDRSNDPRVLSAALRQLHGPHALPRVRALAGHGDALVRSAAALALGRSGATADRALLLALLGDRDWWVRYRAGQALLALPGMDASALAALRAGLADRYARDMLEHVCAERTLQTAPVSPAAVAGSR
jgi:HEAT repeat protein